MIKRVFAIDIDHDMLHRIISATFGKLCLRARNPHASHTANGCRCLAIDRSKSGEIVFSGEVVGRELHRVEVESPV